VQPPKLSLYSVVCPSWDMIPANEDPTNWDESGHGGELNGEAQTRMAAPGDIPSGCQRAKKSSFSLSEANTPVLSADSSGTGPRVAEHRLSDAVFDSGIFVKVEMHSSVEFASLRCYDDVAYGDSLELIYIPRGQQVEEVFCIAFAVGHEEE
jgi:hypothetical protein